MNLNEKNDTPTINGSLNEHVNDQIREYLREYCGTNEESARSPCSTQAGVII